MRSKAIPSCCQDCLKIFQRGKGQKKFAFLISRVHELPIHNKSRFRQENKRSNLVKGFAFHYARLARPNRVNLMKATQEATFSGQDWVMKSRNL